MLKCVWTHTFVAKLFLFCFIELFRCHSHNFFFLLNYQQKFGSKKIYLFSSNSLKKKLWLRYAFIYDCRKPCCIIPIMLLLLLFLFIFLPFFPHPLSFSDNFWNCCLSFSNLNVSHNFFFLFVIPI